MLIRSQNKKEIFVLENISRIEAGKVYGKEDAGWSIEINHSIGIGTYETEDRALEVLDEICNAYQYAKVGEATGLYGSSEPQYVYQMPEE